MRFSFTPTGSVRRPFLDSAIRTVIGILVMAAPLRAENGELIIPIGGSDLEVTADAQGWAVFSNPRMQWLSATGEPEIPWQVITVLLPPDALLETVAVRAEGFAFEALPGQWDVAPARPWATWSSGQEVIAWPADKAIVDGRDVAIYGGAKFWPEASARLLDTGRLRQWKLAQVAIPLVRYHPADRALQRATGGNIIVSFQKTGAGSRAMTPWNRAGAASQIGENSIRRLAINYAEQAAAYAIADAAAAPQAGRRADPPATPRYVIITTSAIQAASANLASFVALKESQGFDVSVVTESDFGGGSGDAAANNIRNWLVGHYLNDNIEYVLLIGDPNPASGTIPMKMLYPRGPTGTDVSAPSDIYYADLTGNWDLDGDGKFGEYSGDWGAGGVDRFWEVIVGRMPYYGTIADLDYILEKSIAYQMQAAGSVVWRRSALLPMRDPDDWTAAYWLGEQIKNDTLIPYSWSYHRVYQSNTGLVPPPETTPCTMANVTNVWKNGTFGLVLWWTHGSATGAVDVMDTSYAAQLNDDHPSFTVQCSCNNAYPEVTNNLCYTLLKKGAVCTLGDTRVSWYQQGQSSFNGSASNSGIAYEYASRLVTYNMTAGHALFDTTLALNPTTDKQWMNFCDFNVYGDPATCVLPRCGRRYVKADATPGGDGTSWATAYKDLQSALDEHATEIWVAAGAYKPDRGTGNRAAFFGLTWNTALYGGFAGTEATRDERNPAANLTILTGDLAGDDGPGLAGNAENSYNVVITRGCDAGCVLDGFTIQGGNANRTANAIQDRGAGLHNCAGSCPAINNCAFIGNSAATAGGAIYNQTGGTSPIFTDCVFAGNYSNNAGGAMSCQSGSHANLTHCLFSGNSSNSNGGALELVSDYVTLVDCTFTGNTSKSGSGGAIRCYSSNAKMINCRFPGNTASSRAGAVYIERGGPTLADCAFSGNAASYGGAMYCYDNSAPKLINCTLVRNVATNTSSGGGGLRDDYNCAPTITNCIFWANQDLNGTTESSQITISNLQPVINYSCVQEWSGEWTGNGNTGADPLLADPDGADNIAGTSDDNLRLLPNSPCIDAGDNTAVPADVLDIDGDDDAVEPLPLDLDGIARFMDDPAISDTGNGTPPIVDMGAYEGARQAFLLSTQSLSIAEGATAGFTVALAMDPGGTVNVTVTPDPVAPFISVQSGGTLSFTSANYAVPQPVVLGSAEDPNNLPEVASIRITATGTTSAGVTVTEIDNDPVADVLYVDAGAPGVNNGSSWATAYTDLQTALTIASTHANVFEIRVAAGTYKPAGPFGNRKAAFRLRNGLALKGGYAGYGRPNPDIRDVVLHETFLSGDLGGNDGPNFANNAENSAHVVNGSGTDATAVLDGFTITAGNANMSSPDSLGGGMYVLNGSPTILDCTFRANAAASAGGLHSQGGNPVLANCRFIGNTATVNGGGLYCMAGGVTLTHCRFMGNTATSSGGGVAFSVGSASQLTNCLFDGNTANSGAGVYDNQTEVALVNCTIVANSSNNSGVGLYGSNATVQVTNCVFWNNKKGGVADQVAQIYVYGTLSINYSCVQGWSGSLGGNGNHGNDPLFLDADGPDNVSGNADDNLRLVSGSPCNDAGQNTAVPAGILTDLDGRSRFLEDANSPDCPLSPGTCGDAPIVDMGAFEFAPPPPGDADGDGDVDGDDLATFELCVSGPAIAYPANCGAWDFDDDSDVDQSDFGVLQGCYGGRGVLVDPDCGS